MRILTGRLELRAPGREAWRALLRGEIPAAVKGYPTEGDLVMARLVVDGHLPAGEWGPWQVIERASDVIVGGAGFKGAPDEMGTVEIGYGLAPRARGRGLATEAVIALVEHAFARGALAVRAEVPSGHAASARVLVRAGFDMTDEDLSVTWWRRDLR